MPNILHINSMSLSLITPSASPIMQSCFAYRENGDWVFGDTENCQFHTDSLDHSLNTYFINCTQERDIVQDGWSGQPLDLVYEQLRRMLSHTREELIVVIPSIYSRPQIASLLGVLNEIINVTSVINTPLAYGGTLPGGEHTVIEIEMHGTVVTKVSVTDDLVTIKESKNFSAFGLQHICNEQYATLRSEFIKRHRYDPDHATVNKAHLLKQLYTQWTATEAGQLYLEINDCGIDIEKEKLTYNLPSDLQKQSESGAYLLIPQPLLPIDRAISKISVLPLLGPENAEWLSKVPAIKGAGEHTQSAVKVFHTLERQ